MHPNPEGDKKCHILEAGPKGERCCKDSDILLHRGFNVKRGKQLLNCSHL